jgi:hypothetical protein
MKSLPKTKTLSLKWDKNDLGWSRNETVEIQLFGYYEDEVPHWDFLQTLGERVPNTGFYEFSIQDNWAVEQNRARRYKLGAVAVTLMTGGTEDPKYLKQFPHILKIYLKNPLFSDGFGHHYNL